MRTQFITENLTIKERKEGNAIRIEVDSRIVNEDPIYNDLTLDSEMDLYYKNKFIQLFKNFK